ncbi:MAG: hypothetical protein U1E60_24620 [Reyranellaceae bacterium]
MSGAKPPRISREVEQLIIRMASDDRSRLAEVERRVFEALLRFLDTRGCVTLNFRRLASRAAL